MHARWFKSLLVAGFSLCVGLFPTSLKAEGGPKMDPSRIILEHVSDGHEFHFFTIGDRLITLPLPVILYAPGKGWTICMSSVFDHGKTVYHGYRLLEEGFIDEHKLDEAKYKAGRIYVADAQGMPDAGAKLYDFSLTRNAVQVIISVILLVWIMTSVAAQYAKGEGVKNAPTGFQNALEPVIVFVRDEVGKSNLGDRYEKYMPLLLSIFFFILINSLLSLLPGTANVAGNIAFTGMLGLIAFLVILFSSDKHYWGHIANPPVPVAIKPIMIPVEIIGLFTKPFALIIRLFANMISGHIIILSFIILIFIFGAMNVGLGWGTSPFFVLMAVFIYLIEILVAFIQAFIFANLTAVFIGQAFEGSRHHHDKEPSGHGVEEVAIL